jgi:hypothetical protein
MITTQEVHSLISPDVDSHRFLCLSFFFFYFLLKSMDQDNVFSTFLFSIQKAKAMA